jgi:hypothetical protein
VLSCACLAYPAALCGNIGTAEQLCQPCGDGFSSLGGALHGNNDFIRCYPRDLRFLEPGEYAFTLADAAGTPGAVYPAVNLTVFCVGAGGWSSGLRGGGGGGGSTFYLQASGMPRDQVMVVHVGSAAVAASGYSGFVVVRTGSLPVRYNRGWPGASAPAGRSSQDNDTHGVGGAGGVPYMGRRGSGPKQVDPITIHKWCAGGDGGSVPVGVNGSAGGGGAGGYSKYPEALQPVPSYLDLNITWPSCSGGAGGAPGQNGAGGRGEGAAGGGGGSRGTTHMAGGGGAVGLLGRKQTGPASGSYAACLTCGQGGSSTTYLGGDDGAVAQANKSACLDDTKREWPICGGEYGGGAPGGRDGVTRLGGNGACIVLLPANGRYPANVWLPDRYGY